MNVVSVFSNAETNDIEGPREAIDSGGGVEERDSSPRW